MCKRLGSVNLLQHGFVNCACVLHYITIFDGLLSHMRVLFLCRRIDFLKDRKVGKSLYSMHGIRAYLAWYTILLTISI